MAAHTGPGLGLCPLARGAPSPGPSVNIGAGCSGECGLGLGPFAPLALIKPQRGIALLLGMVKHSLLTHKVSELFGLVLFVMMGCSFMWSSLFLLIACESTAMLRSTRRKLMLSPFARPSFIE